MLGDEFRTGDFAILCEQRDGVWPPFDDPRFNSIGAVAEAVDIAVQDSQRNQSFTLTDRDDGRDGDQYPRIGEKLQGCVKAQLMWLGFAGQRGLQHGVRV